MGDAERIIAYTQSDLNLKIPCKEPRMFLQSVRMEDTQLTNEAFFQVLKVEVEGNAGYFWRPSNGGDWFERHMDPTYLAR